MSNDTSIDNVNALVKKFAQACNEVYDAQENIVVQEIIEACLSTVGELISLCPDKEVQDKMIKDMPVYLDTYIKFHMKNNSKLN